MLIKSLICLLAVMPAAAIAQSADAEIYLLAGQSNMVGYGSIDGLTTADKTRHEEIRLFGNDYKYHYALDPLDSTTGQVDTVSFDNTTGVGPGLFFARSLYNLRGRRVVLVPCAKGGTSISLWAPATARTTLYGSCLNRAREVALGRPIAGILWYQGEADARTVAKANAWPAAFRTMITQLRTDLGQPKLPVVFVGLGTKARDPDKAAVYPAWEQMQNSQAAMPPTLTCSAHVSAPGLPQNADQLHLNTPAHRTLGPLLATQMDRLKDSGCN